MFDATITRDKKFTDCTLGTMVAKGKTFYTLERPWLENISDISCIPCGAYRCTFKNHEKLGDVYIINDVPLRSGILIHVGNYVHESHGCILLGLGRDIEKKTVVSSRLAIKQFVELMGPSFTLAIVDA
jgi:hypothetical protein